MPNLSQQVIDSVREHKKNATPAQVLLAQKLRFRNIVFIMEYPVLTERSFFTADFYIPRHGLLIEVDGKCHKEENQHRKDVIKDIVYESLGYHVLRIKNSDIDTFDTLSIRDYRKGRIRVYEALEEVPNYKKKRGKLRTKIKRRK